MSVHMNFFERHIKALVASVLAIVFVIILLTLAVLTGSAQAQTSNVPRAATPPADFYRDGARVNAGLTGGGTITLDAAGYLRWTDRIISIGGGGSTNPSAPGAVYADNGYYDIYMPTVGTVIPVIGPNVSPITVTAAGILLNQWGALYYRLSGGGNASVNGNYVFVGYGQGNFTVTPDLVLIAASNADFQTVRLGTGQHMQRGNRIIAGLPEVIPTPPTDFYRDGGKPNTIMTGGGLIRFDANAALRWSDRFIVLGGGASSTPFTPGSVYSGVGYYDIFMPPVGTVIPARGNGSPITVTAAGIVLPAWGALYYRLPGNNVATVNSNFVWVGFGNGDYAVTPDMVLVAAYNADNANAIRLGTGQTITRPINIPASSAAMLQGDLVQTFGMRAQTLLTGGGRPTWNGFVFNWTDRFITIGGGSQVLQPIGHHNIFRPPAGSTALVANNSTAWAPRAFTAAGIQLNAWEALYYELPLGGPEPTLNGNFFIVPYFTNATIPPHWVMLAVTNPENQTLKLGTGVILGGLVAPLTGALPNYGNANAANNDGALPANSLYTITTGNGANTAKQVFIK